MGMLSARTVPLKIVMQITSIEASANFFDIVWVTFGPYVTNHVTTRLLEFGGRIKSNSN